MFLVLVYVQAGFDCGERLWRMPFYKHYTEQIESDVADLRNTGKKRYVKSKMAPGKNVGEKRERIWSEEPRAGNLRITAYQ